MSWSSSSETSTLGCAVHSVQPGASRIAESVWPVNAHCDAASGVQLVVLDLRYSALSLKLALTVCMNHGIKLEKVKSLRGVQMNLLECLQNSNIVISGAGGIRTRTELSLSGF